MDSATTAAYDAEWLARQFDSLRPHLRTVAYRMLGSISEADDALQESWLRLSRNDATAIDDLRGWLTTVVGRICLDMLRARKASRTQYAGTWLPEPVLSEDSHEHPEEQALLADSVGIAMLVVLETLTPAERLAFVLHDVFAVPFDEIAPIIERTPDAARQLASRARRRVRAAPEPESDVVRQRQVVDAFVAAAQAGDFTALVEVLDPDVVFRLDSAGTPGPPLPPLHGAQAVAKYLLANAPRYISGVHPIIVNGAAGNVFGTARNPRAVVSFTIVRGRISEINLIANREKLSGSAEPRRRT
jgi:RNA polymerase sigma factor (sigma-70 family)